MTATNERLSEALNELSAVDAEIEAFEKRIKELKERKNALETITLIDLFNETGLREAVLATTGQKAKRELVATGSLNKDPSLRKQAIEWLVATGYGDSIENTVTSSYARGDRDRALAIYNQLRSSDNAAKVTFDEGIHHSTLKRIARDCITRGLPVPLTTLGVDVVSRVHFVKR